MTAEFARLVAFVDAYLASGDYMSLWSPIAGPVAADHEPGPFATREVPLWDDLYDLVYMGQQKPATAAEALDGLVGGEDLRTRLIQWRLNALAALSS